MATLTNYTFYTTVYSVDEIAVVKNNQIDTYSEMQLKLAEEGINKYFIYIKYTSNKNVLLVFNKGKEFKIYGDKQIYCFLKDRYPEVMEAMFDKFGFFTKNRESIESKWELNYNSIEELKNFNPKHIDIDYFKFYFESHNLVEITHIDPTPNKKYFKWICNVFINKYWEDYIKIVKSSFWDSKINEDSSKINSLLTKFDKPILKATLKRIGKSIDLNDYKTDSDLFSVIQLVEEEEITDTNTELYEKRTIFEDDNWIVVQATNFKESQIFGSGTYWCTAGSDDAEESFNDYSDEGRNPLVIFINKENKKEKYQWSPYLDDFLNWKDNTFIIDEVFDLNFLVEFYKSFGDAPHYVLQEFIKNDLFLEELSEHISAHIRLAVCERGVFLDKFISDFLDIVRIEVVNQGYGLDRLMNDGYPRVRLAVLEKGYIKAAKKLRDDKDKNVAEKAKEVWKKYKSGYDTYINQYGYELLKID